jgi:hypothetical protein
MARFSLSPPANEPYDATLARTVGQEYNHLALEVAA